MRVFPARLEIIAVLIVLSVTPKNTMAEDLMCTEDGGPDEISSIDFERFDSDLSFIGPSVLFDGEITVAGSVVAGGDIEATGSVCSADGCIGDPVSATVQEALITFDLPANTDGGSAPIDDAWVTRDLNSVVYDLGGIVVALSGDQILLDPGTYIISANQIFYSAGGTIRSVRGRLRDVTNGQTVALSLNGRLNANGSTGYARAEIPPSVVTVTALTGIELQYFIEVSSTNTFSLGRPLDTGEVERYAYVHLRKVSP